MGVMHSVSRLFQRMRAAGPSPIRLPRLGDPVVRLPFENLVSARRALGTFLALVLLRCPSGLAQRGGPNELASQGRCVGGGRRRPRSVVPWSRAGPAGGPGLSAVRPEAGLPFRSNGDVFAVPVPFPGPDLPPPAVPPLPAPPPAPPPPFS